MWQVLGPDGRTDGLKKGVRDSGQQAGPGVKGVRDSGQQAGPGVKKKVSIPTPTQSRAWRHALEPSIGCIYPEAFAKKPLVARAKLVQILAYL